MIFMTMLLVFVFYVVLAVAFVLFVRRRAKKKSYLFLAIAFVILLPTWDVLLGYIVYDPACLFIPKVAIYETAETDSIYFEGLHNYLYKLEPRVSNEPEDESIRIGSIYRVCHRGYSFAEALVVEKHTITPETRERIAPVIYRCIALPKDETRPAFKRTSCTIVSEAKSRYMVKVRTLNAGTAEINFKRIYERSTGKLMAEYNQVTRWALAGSYGVPFFNWLELGDGSKAVGSEHCPANYMDYESFEYEVLKPKDRS
jgi:hypothetical protein